METDWHRNDHDLQTLVVPLAENCYYSGIPEEEVTRRTIMRYYKRKNPMLIREMIRNVYKECKGVPKSNCLTKEQRLSLQMDEFMKRRYEFRYNTLTTEVEYRERNSFNFYFRPVDKRVLASITMNAMYEGVKVWDRDVIRYLDSDHVPVYQPVEDFLYHLPHWDGKTGFWNWPTVFPVIIRIAPLFRRWFLNMVAHWRGMDKKHANSTSPLLIGPQAYWKSTFCRMLLPPALQAYYTDSIDFSRKRDAELYLNRFLLINMDEFDQISPTQQAFLKHILQKPVVNTRRPNASAVEELRRYASFIATSNHRDLLTDTSGSRRFIGIYMTGAIDVSRPIDYEQLYAQALELLYHNERYWFDSEEEAIMTENNRELNNHLPSNNYLWFIIAGRKKRRKAKWLLAIDILRRIQKASKMTFSARQASYFGRILQRLGVKSNGNVWYVLSCYTFGGRIIKYDRYLVFDGLSMIDAGNNSYLSYLFF